jgi:hypothetical protein
MPATRSRTSTEQPAEVAPEDVKVQDEGPKEIVDTPVQEEPIEKPVEAEPVVEPPVEAVPAAVPEVSESAPAPVEETNGTAEVVPETNGTVETNGVAGDAAIESVPVEQEVVEKRKSIQEGEDAPDTTEVVVKKAKVDEEAAAEEVPVVEASA